MASIDKLLGEAGATILSIALVNKRLQVTWVDDSVDEYPLLMLRDACNCSQCFNPIVNSRLILFEQLFGSSAECDSASIKDNTVCMAWSDGHVSKLSADWLYNRRLNQSAIEERMSKVYSRAVESPWTESDPAKIIKRRNYDEIVGCPKGIVEMAECLIRDGVYLIEGAPLRICLAEFLKSIGAVHAATHYGPDNWDVKYIPNANGLPYSNKKLELHIDMPYLAKPCQLQLLRCQQQCIDGGENKLSDCLKAALTLKQSHPEEYHVLTTIEIDFQYIKKRDPGAGTDLNQQWFICNRRPLIQEDPVTGLPTLCRFAAEVRCSTFNQSPEVVEGWWDAFRCFHKILEDNCIWIKAKPGDILAFNNGRVMHAREAFDSSQARELEGIYAEMDYLMSAWRMAQVNLAAQA